MSGLYVHIPFCHAKCAYCDFYSMPRRGGEGEYVAAVCRELDMRIAELPTPIDTIYLGGGTPSILSPESLSTLVGAILKHVGDVREFTIEANPEDVTPAPVAHWRDLGIDRVSMGVQSLDDAQLALVGRRHTASQAIDAVATIRSQGIDNISLDLIYGLPGQTLDSWRDSLCHTLDMQPSHLSAYMLSYEPRTRLTAMLKTGQITEVAEDVIVEMYHVLTDTARQYGYRHYEVSNFALPGCEAKHNSSYWHGVPYLGLGPGAHSFDGHTRRINPSDLRRYLAEISSGRPAYIIDDETDDNRFNDLVMTALRTAEGLDLSSVPPSRLSQLMRDARPHLASGALCLQSNYLIIPEPSWLISDAILTDLMQ